MLVTHVLSDAETILNSIETNGLTHFRFIYAAIICHFQPQRTRFYITQVTMYHSDVTKYPYMEIN